MTTTTTTSTYDLVTEALASFEAWGASTGSTYALAAAAGMLFAYMAQRTPDGEELPTTASHGTPWQVMRLLEAHPELDKEWRKLAAARQLARLIAKGMDNEPSRVEEALEELARCIVSGPDVPWHEAVRLGDNAELCSLVYEAVGGF